MNIAWCIGTCNLYIHIIDMSVISMANEKVRQFFYQVQRIGIGSF